MELNLDKFKNSQLFLEEFVILALINEGEDVEAMKFNGNLKLILSTLEQELWITRGSEGYELRGKGRELFQNTSSSEALEVLEYLNKKFKEIKPRARGYSPVKSNLQYINARLKEKNTVEDLKSVIDVMCSKWKNTPYEDYIRPETLFNDKKFQTYINLAANFKEENGRKSIFTIAGENK